MFEDSSEINVIYFSDGETWERVENCTIIFRAIYDKSQNLVLPGEDSVAIKLEELIPLALQQVMRNKAIKIYKPPTPPIP
jgi:hypothetical protein